MTRQLVNLGGVRLAVHSQGQGRPVVLIHGLSGSGRWWKRNVPALSAHHRVYVVELAGYGAARRQPALGVRAAADFIARWLSEADLRDVTLVGHSMGGHISIHVAALLPERVSGLVLVCASGLLSTTPYRAALQLPRAALVSRKAFLPRIVRDAARAGPLNLWRNTRDLLRDSVREELAAIRARTLVVWGERDPLVPVTLGRQLAAAIPGARLKVIPGAGHVVMVDAPDEFNAAVGEFLLDLERAPSSAPAAR